MRYGAVIVAAGVSSYMGRLRPMLPVGRESIIQRTIRMMKKAGADPIVVIIGYQKELMQEHLKDEDIILLHNECYVTTKMFDSAIMGFRELIGKCERILFSPGVVPIMKSDTVEILKNSTGQFIRPIYKGMAGHPVVIDSNIIPSILNYHGKFGLRGAVTTCDIKIEEIPVDDECIIMDINTKKDYEELLHQNDALTGRQEKLHMELQISLGTDEVFFDISTAIFLELISITGSMRSACHAMNISYTKGWKMVNKLERKLNTKILLRNVGGLEGGGSYLTEEGYHLIQAYNSAYEEIEKFGKEIFLKYFNI